MLKPVGDDGEAEHEVTTEPCSMFLRARSQIETREPRKRGLGDEGKGDLYVETTGTFVVEARGCCHDSSRFSLEGMEMRQKPVAVD